jgi:hypothetical protein
MIKFKLTQSEKKIIGKIRKMVNYIYGQKYMFSLIYNDMGFAINWEGGYDLSLEGHFRNQFTLEHGKKLIKNW